MRRMVIVLLLAGLFALACSEEDTDKEPNNKTEDVAGEEDVALPEEIAEGPEDLVEAEDLPGLEETAEPLPDVVAEEDLAEPPEEDLVQPEEDVVAPEEDIPTTEDTATPPAGACTNDADMAIFQQSQEMESAVSGCVMGCLAQGVPCWTQCVHDATGLSMECSGCFGETIKCTVDNCMFQCMDSSSQGCADCREQKCADAFFACAGVPMT